MQQVEQRKLGRALHHPEVNLPLEEVAETILHLTELVVGLEAPVHETKELAVVPEMMLVVAPHVRPGLSPVLSIKRLKRLLGLVNSEVHVDCRAQNRLEVPGLVEGLDVVLDDLGQNLHETRRRFQVVLDLGHVCLQQLLQCTTQIGSST